MEFQGYFEPTSVSGIFRGRERPGSLLEHIHFNTTEKQIADLTVYDAVIIGITENRNNRFKGNENLPDLVRKKLYSLSSFGGKKKIIDLGNFVSGKSVEDTYIGLRDVIAFLLKENKIPILIGGSLYTAYACYLAYEYIKRNVSITAISPRVELITHPDGLEETWLNKILNFRGEHFFNFSGLGYQSCMVTKQELDLAEKLNFDAYRLGTVRSNLRDTEPVLRDTDLLTFDISSIKQSDAPGCNFPSPNGFYSEEACQLSRYAGISDKLSCFGLFEINPEKDFHDQTIQLSAEIIWYFLEGFSQRRKEYPLNNPGKFIKYIVTLEGKGEDLVFYKSQETNRWWIEVPSTKYNSSVMIACTYEDYQKASAQELPDRWWRTYQKIN